VYVPVVPVFRSILKPSSLLELSVQANWSWPALAWFCQVSVPRRKKKIRMKHLRTLRSKLISSPQAAAITRPISPAEVPLLWRDTTRNSEITWLLLNVQEFF
jgi:hypothetical protein